MDQDIKIHVSVKANGSGDYKTVEAAIDAVPAGNTIPFTINIGKGTYKEVLNIFGDKGFVILIGAGRDNTILTYDNYSGNDNGRSATIGTTGSAWAFLYGSNFTAKF